MCVVTWQDGSQAVRGPARGDAPDDAVKQEADLLAISTGQEEHTSPWKTDGGGERKAGLVVVKSFLQAKPSEVQLLRLL